MVVRTFVPVINRVISGAGVLPELPTGLGSLTVCFHSSSAQRHRHRKRARVSKATGNAFWNYYSIDYLSAMIASISESCKRTNPDVSCLLQCHHRTEALPLKSHHSDTPGLSSTIHTPQGLHRPSEFSFVCQLSRVTMLNANSASSSGTTWVEHVHPALLAAPEPGTLLNSPALDLIT